MNAKTFRRIGVASWCEESGPEMKQFQRAAQLWSLLVLAARNQQILSYTAVEHLTGMDKRGIGKYGLGPIFWYCRAHKLPWLTVLVVEEGTGLPGKGFMGEAKKEFGDDANIFQLQSRVFAYDWFKRRAPKQEDFEGAIATGRKKQLPA
jgi:hypothetical protein